MTTTTSVRARRTSEHCRFYRERGWNPLPSDPGKKKPLVKFREFWETPAPADLFRRFPEANIQVMTGTFWRLAVLDLDGPEAVGRVASEWPKLPPTWTVFHSDAGRNSRHLWFSLPAGLEPKGKQVLWQALDDDGTPRKHAAVELLCDRCLVTAPPSVHVRTGREYRFTRKPDPRTLAELPEWVWSMPPVQAPKPKAEWCPRTPPVQPSARFGRKVTTTEVLAAVPDLASLARRWGLRVLDGDGRGSDGWVSCHDFNRADDNPSASFNVVTGRFWRPGMARGETLSLFDLSAELGAFRDWQDARDSLASEFLRH